MTLPVPTNGCVRVGGSPVRGGVLICAERGWPGVGACGCWGTGFVTPRSPHHAGSCESTALSMRRGAGWFGHHDGPVPIAPRAFAPAIPLPVWPGAVAERLPVQPAVAASRAQVPDPTPGLLPAPARTRSSRPRAHRRPFALFSRMTRSAYDVGVWPSESATPLGLDEWAECPDS